jgi:hypothetical protein
LRGGFLALRAAKRQRQRGVDAGVLYFTGAHTSYIPLVAGGLVAGGRVSFTE